METNAWLDDYKGILRLIKPKAAVDRISSVKDSRDEGTKKGTWYYYCRYDRYHLVDSWRQYFLFSCSEPNCCGKMEQTIDGTFCPRRAVRRRLGDVSCLVA